MVRNLTLITSCVGVDCRLGAWLWRLGVFIVCNFGSFISGWPSPREGPHILPEGGNCFINFWVLTKKGTRSWQWIVYAFCWGTHISVVVAAMHLWNFCMPSLFRNEAIAWVCRSEKGMWNSGFFSVTLPARLSRSPLHLLPPASADDASIWGPKISGCMSVSLSGLLTDGLVIIASVYFWYPTCLFWKWKLILVQFQVCTKVTTHLTPPPPIFELIIFMH